MDLDLYTRRIASKMLLHRLQIGNVELENNIVLAPMAGVTDLPFRLLCKRQGVGLICMEMVSAKAIMYNNKNTEKLLEIEPEEMPVSLQFFGNDPEIMASQAARIEDRPFAVLDINMGCPVPKVVNNGEGSALLKNPKLAAEIVKKVSGAISKPVTVKIRKGFDEDHVNAVEMAKYLEDAGASAIAVHGRTREQYYSGKADWEIIAKVKEAVSIPVIGNGDIDGPLAAEKMIKETGVDGIMVGRASQGNPWIFSEIRHYLETGVLAERPSIDEIKRMIHEHSELMLKVKGEYIGIREMRRHVSWYTAGMHGSAALRKRVCAVESFDELYALLEELK